MIVENVAPSYETFENLRDYIYENVSSDIPAFGVMFCDTSNRLMTPVVYVKEADTTYFEGSCASGAVAASFAFSGSLGDGTHDFTFEQPERDPHYPGHQKERPYRKYIPQRTCETLAENDS